MKGKPEPQGHRGKPGFKVSGFQGFKETGKSRAIRTVTIF
jgi:hypothetical protein